LSALGAGSSVLYGSGHNRGLRSFPTRRSSDLLIDSQSVVQRRVRLDEPTALVNGIHYQTVSVHFPEVGSAISLVVVTEVVRVDSTGTKDFRCGHSQSPLGDEHVAGEVVGAGVPHGLFPDEPARSAVGGGRRDGVTRDQVVLRAVLQVDTGDLTSQAPNFTGTEDGAAV